MHCVKLLVAYENTTKYTLDDKLVTVQHCEHVKHSSFLKTVFSAPAKLFCIVLLGKTVHGLTSPGRLAHSSNRSVRNTSVTITFI